MMFFVCLLFLVFQGMCHADYRYLELTAAKLSHNLCPDFVAKSANISAFNSGSGLHGQPK